jgi:hypothetical protein
LHRHDRGDPKVSQRIIGFSARGVTVTGGASMRAIFRRLIDFALKDKATRQFSPRTVT